MLVKKTLTTGKPIVTEHVEAEDVYALAKSMDTGAFRLFSMAYDAYGCPKNALVNDYERFCDLGRIPLYVQSYVLVHLGEKDE